MTEPMAAFQQFLRDYARPPEVDPRLLESEAFGANPGNLRMLSYAPPRLPRGAPLVVVLHGCTQSASGYAVGAGWLELAARHGFAVLCPEQRIENNANRCFNWFEPKDVTRGAGEAASILAMVDRVIAEHAVDRRRVYVTGLSAGGAMTAALLAAYPERFAGGAVVAGLPVGAAGNIQQALGAMMQGRKRAPAEWGDYVRSASQHAGPWPKVSIWHGDADATVAPANALSLAVQWANVHGAPDQPTWSEVRGARTYSAWGARDAPVVELHVLPGMAHGAPLSLTAADAVGAAGPFLLEAGVSSSDEIASFWDIAPSSGSAAQRTSPETSSSAKRPNAPQQSNKKQGFDLGSTLRNALRSAGLLRR